MKEESKKASSTKSAPKAAVKVKDIAPKKDAKGGAAKTINKPNFLK